MSQNRNKSFSCLSKLCVFGFLCGGVAAIIITLFVTVGEWLENPSGIFHGPDGTNWEFVFQTAISWLVPTFICATIVALIVRLIGILIKCH